MNYISEINNMRWSFSRLHMWENCPYSWYLKYIEKRDGEQNFFAANGKIMHELFEDLLSKNMTLDESPVVYTNKFDEICSFTKESTMEKTFEKCINYLCTVDDIDKKYEILGIELSLEFKIKQYDFIGFVDCLLKNTETGEIVLVDHKSSDHFMKKDGTPLKNKLEDFNTYRKQMYIYCKGIKDCLGLQVDKIVWHHFKDNGALTVVPFEQNILDDTVKWVEDTIEQIKNDERFEDKKSFMMCSQLCDYRYNCEYLEKE